MNHPLMSHSSVGPRAGHLHATALLALRGPVALCAQHLVNLRRAADHKPFVGEEVYGKTSVNLRRADRRRLVGLH